MTARFIFYIKLTISCYTVYYNLQLLSSDFSRIYVCFISINLWIYENAEKPQRYRHCVIWEKREFFFFFFFFFLFFFCKNGNGVMFCLFDSRTCLESLPRNEQYPSFPAVFHFVPKKRPRMRQKCAICLPYSQRRSFEVPPLSRSRITFVKTWSPLLFPDSPTSFKIFDPNNFTYLHALHNKFILHLTLININKQVSQFL